MYIVFPIKFNCLQWCNGYLASLPGWRPRFDSRGRKYFFVFNLIFPIFYTFCNNSLVAFYIKFNALAKFSPATFFFFFFLYIYKFSNPNRIITVMVIAMRLCHFFLFVFCQICVAIFWSQSFQHTQLKILVNFESGVHVFSGVLCRNAWNSAIHLFIIWLTDILANLDIQTELQDCLYEYGFKDKWYRLELLASVVLHVLHCDCIKIYDDVAVKTPIVEAPNIFWCQGKGL